LTAVRPASRTFSALKVPNFRLFFIGQGISQIGNSLTLLTQSLLVYELTNRGFVLGLINAFQFAPVLLLSAWTGTLADRSDKRKMLIRVQALGAVQSAALFVVASLDEPPVAAICTLACMGGVLASFDNPCRRAIVAETVPESEVTSAVNLNSALMTSSTVIGPALGGVLIVLFGYSAAFGIDAISYVAVLAALFRMDPSKMRRPVPLPKARGQIRYGLHQIRSQPALRLPVGMAALAGAAYNFTVLVPLLVKDTFGRSTGTFTFIYTCLSIGSVIGALSVARRGRIEARDLVRGNLWFAAVMVGLALVPWVPLLAVWAMVVGIVSMSVFTASVTTLQIHSDPRARGRIMALHSACFLGAFALGAPVLGWLAEVSAPRVAIVAAAGFAAASAAWGGWMVRRDRLRAESVEAAVA